MRQEQLDAFNSTPPRFTRARRSDSLGSHDAAAAIEESGYAKKTGQRVRAAVRRWPGLTTHELARIAHIDRHDVGRRMSELERVGAVRRVQISTVANPTENTKPCSIAGVRAIRWWPK